MRKKLRLISSLIAVLGVLALGAAACGSDDSSGGGGALTMAIVAPSASDDLAFSQSMVDSVNALERDITLQVTDGTFIVEDAAAAIRGYAEDGVDVILAHGTQIGASLAAVSYTHLTLQTIYSV